jgi:hypothetical protein
MSLRSWLKQKCNRADVDVKVVREDLPAGGPNNFDVTIIVTRIGGSRHTKQAQCDEVKTFKWITNGRYQFSVDPGSGNLYAFTNAPTEKELTSGDNGTVTLTLAKLELTDLDIAPIQQNEQKYQEKEVAQRHIDALTGNQILWKQYINLELTSKDKAANAPIIANANAILNPPAPAPAIVTKASVVAATLADTPGRKMIDNYGKANVPLADAQKMVRLGHYHVRSYKEQEIRAQEIKDEADQNKTQAEADENTAKLAYEADQTNAGLQQTYKEKKAIADKARANANQAQIDLVASRAKEMDPRSMGRCVEVEAKINVEKKDIDIYFEVVPAPVNANGNFPWNNAAADGREAKLKEKMTPFDALNGNLPKTVAVKTDIKGRAFASFKLSRVGGDKFNIVASLKSNPSTHLAEADITQKSRDIQTWRKIWYQLTYSEQSGLPPRSLAIDDFKKLMIVAEEESETSYNPDKVAGVDTSKKWQYENTAPKGTLYPGKSTTVLVQIIQSKAETITSAHAGDFLKITDSTNNKMVKKRVEVFSEGKLKVTDGDWTPPNVTCGNSSALAAKEYTLKNVGGRAIAYTAEKDKEWLILDPTKGILPPNAQTALKVRVNAKADALAAGSPSETGKVTITNTTANPNAVEERQVKLNITGDGKAGDIEVAPTSHVHSIGKIGEAFSPAQSQPYTLKNTGASKADFTISRTKVWLEVQTAAEANGAVYTKKQCQEANTKRGELEKQKRDEEAKKEEERKKLETITGAKNIIAQHKKIDEISARIKKLEQDIELQRDLSKRLKQFTGNIVSVGTLNANGQASATLRVLQDKVTAFESDTVTFQNATASKSTDRKVTLLKPAELSVAAGNWNPAAFGPGDLIPTVSKEYEIENKGGGEFDYTVSKSKDWVILHAEGGTLNSGEKRNIKVEVIETANELATGDHEDIIHFKQSKDAAVDIQRKAKLTVQDLGTGLKVTTANGANDVYNGSFSSKAGGGFVKVGGVNKLRGPFAPASRQFTIVNNSNARIEYEVSRTADWISITSDDEVVCVGSQNKTEMMRLLKQPSVQRPKTAHLIMCDRQWDAVVSDQSAQIHIDRTDWHDAKLGSSPLGIFMPPLQGGDILDGGGVNDWEWTDGGGAAHTGPIDNGMISVERDRTSTRRFNITLPAQCPGTCACGGGTNIQPSNANRATVNFKIKGSKGPYLGEGGKETSPHTLIVIEDTGKAARDENSINDTVSHEIGHMYHQTQAKKADAQAILNKYKKTNYYKNVLKPNFSYYYEGGTPDHPNQYTGRGGQGPHCSKDAVHRKNKKNKWILDDGKKEWFDGSCILYHAGRDVKLNWCEDCKKVWKFINLNRFSY